MACKVVLFGGNTIRDCDDAETAAEEAWGDCLALTDPGDEHKTYVPVSNISWIEEEFDDD